MTKSQSALIAFAFAFGLFASGCSESNRAISPLSPTPPLDPSGAPGARVAGTVTGATSNTTVAVEGTTISDNVDAAGQFELVGVPPGDIQLRFEDGGIAAALPIPGVAAEDQIHINVTLTGGSANLDGLQRTSSDHGIEVKGLLSNLTGSCPTVRFIVIGTTVATSAATRFEDGTCATVQNGVRVEVKGTLQPDGTLLASKVDIESPSPNPSVQVKGVVAGHSGTCPALTFTVNGTTVVTDNLTRFEDGVCTDIENGTNVDVKGTQQSNGTVLATKVDIDRPHPPSPPNPSVELKGLVAGRSGACPAISFTVNGTTITTNSATRVEDGLCTDVQNGTRVEVKGTQQSNGSVLATKVDIDRPDPPNPHVSLKGIVAGRSGACPAITFSVNGTTIATDSLTRFEDGTCAEVVNGTDVDVKGTQQPNGSVLATKVDIDNPDPDVEVKGIVSGRSGSCPALTFTVNGVTIATQASTRYEDGLCADIQNGTRVEVKGIRQSNGTVIADKIDIDHPDPDPEVELKGLVSSLGGACPNRTFTINGTQVTTNSATRFEDGSCGTLQNGTRVEVKGTRQSNGSVLARKVDIDR